MSLEYSLLVDRAMMLRQARLFFSELNIIEADTPALVKCPNLDPHIESIEANPLNNDRGYLHTSPEYGLKRLLCYYGKDFYQLSHVFRKNELGALHNPEFMLAEWYRKDTTLDAFLAEIKDFIALFLGNLPTCRLTYQEAFLQYVNIDYKEASFKKLQELTGFFSEATRDDLLQLIMHDHIEPQLTALTIITDYPKSQAALAQVKGDTAERFEFFYQGITTSIYVIGIYK